MFGALRTTVIGGIVFLIPIVVVVFVVGKALGWLSRVSDPIAAALPFGLADTVVLSHLIAFALLVSACFVAGAAARTRMAGRFIELLEDGLLNYVPFYVLLKARTESVLQPHDVEDLTPVVVQLDDSWQFAFEIERVEGGAVALFVPGSPDPWSGSVIIVEEGRVSALDIDVPILAKLARRIGRGSNEALRNYFARG